MTETPDDRFAKIHPPTNRQFLDSCDVVDTDHESLHQLVDEVGGVNVVERAKRLFEWVRDNVDHSGDANHTLVTCNASDVLKYRTGLCYAKSHLLCALLRIANIPSALCYQRLKIGKHSDRYCLHGLCAIHLPDFGWYRVDPRGNRPGISAQFCPPREQLAFPIEDVGEEDITELFEQPLKTVVTALNRFNDCQDLLDNLPDVSEGNR